MDHYQAKIILVDDDEIDARIVKSAFEKQRIANPLIVARDGIEALDILRSETNQAGPLLILLDLNMPRMGGIEFLDELRADPLLRHHVVFVLTTSKADEDKFAAYERHVAGYLVKSEAGRDLMNHLPLLQQYLITVHLPKLDGLSKSDDDTHRVDTNAIAAAIQDVTPTSIG